MNFTYRQPLKQYGQPRRKRWRHWKRQLQRRGINTDYYPAPFKMSYIASDLQIIGKIPDSWTIPIIYEHHLPIPTRTTT